MRREKWGQREGGLGAENGCIPVNHNPSNCYDVDSE